MEEGWQQEFAQELQLELEQVVVQEVQAALGWVVVGLAQQP